MNLAARFKFSHCMPGDVRVGYAGLVARHAVRVRGDLFNAGFVNGVAAPCRLDRQLIRRITQAFDFLRRHRANALVARRGSDRNQVMSVALLRARR